MNMPEAFKDKFSVDMISAMARKIGEFYADFSCQNFINDAAGNIQNLELKARSNQIKDALHRYLPNDFETTANVILASLAPPSNAEAIQFDYANSGLCGWMLMPVTDYIADKALETNLVLGNQKQPTTAAKAMSSFDDTSKTATLPKHFMLGLELLHACTQRFSAEFSIRPFLRDYPKATLAVLSGWALDENVHVRRLVSEGTRPFLPWGLRLNVFADNPSLIIPLLEQLKSDKSEYVRRSVANNLNDIAKCDAPLVINIAKKWWQEGDKKRTKLIKHACRTLIKNGDVEVLKIFGFGSAQLAKVDLVLGQQKIRIGETQLIQLSIQNALAEAQNILIDYAVHHQKANGELTAKVFKWTNFVLAAKESKTITKTHSFKIVTTRKYYPGEHKIEILINGKALSAKSFTLL